MWRELAPLSSVYARGRKHFTTDLGKRVHPYYSAREERSKLGKGVLTPVGMRTACSSTHQEGPAAGDPPAATDKALSSTSSPEPRKRRRKQERKQQDVTMDTRPHPPGLLLDSELKAAKRGVMREAVGKGKVELTPIAILPSKNDHKPLRYTTGNRTMDYETLQKVSRKERRVLTNENLIQGEFELTNLERSWASDRVLATMTKGVTPGVAEVVTYLAKEVGVSEEDAHRYLKSSPSLLGPCVEDLRRGACRLESLGFSKRQVATILPRFPSSVDLDWSNLREVYLLLSEEMKIGEKAVVSLMKRHPFIFTFDSTKVSPCHDSAKVSPCDMQTVTL